MKPVISLLLLTLSFQLFSQSKLIKFEDGHLTVEVDNKWISSEAKRTLTLSQNSIPENLQITLAFKDNSSLEELYRVYITESLPNEFQGFEIIEETEQVINDLRFKLILFNTRQNEIKYQTIVYLTMNDNIGYAFIGTSTPSRMELVSSDFLAIVSSVKFLAHTTNVITRDETIQQVYGKKWLLYSQDFGFGNLPVSANSKIHFELVDNEIMQSKIDESERCNVTFEYDSSKKEIKFFCRGRNMSKKILEITSNRLTTQEIDEVGESIKRTYKVSN